jgi:putative ABC transport system permease protein
VAVAVLSVAKVPVRWAPPLAVLRAIVQLGVRSAVLGGVITNPGWVAMALLVMFTVAAATSTKRLNQINGKWSWRRFALIAASMICGVLVATGIVFATGAVAFTPRYMLALGGIVIGNSMSISTLAGRRLYSDANQRWDEVEGWLSVGATPRQATSIIRRESIREALIPSVDQTRTVGLVTLPGTFVGAIFGGASPVEAAIFQVLTLACILTAGAITSSLLLTALAGIRQKPSAP